MASQPIYVPSIKPSIKAPPYKNPPAYGGANSPVNSSPSISQKTVTFADSPVLLRRKVCFEDEVIGNQSQQQQMPTSPRRMSKDTPAPAPPPRSEGTRLSTISSPRRLADSDSNPPHDFLQDLQRVMRKKWQISQRLMKCSVSVTSTTMPPPWMRNMTRISIENRRMLAIGCKSITALSQLTVCMQILAPPRCPAIDAQRLYRLLKSVRLRRHQSEPTPH